MNASLIAELDRDSCLDRLQSYCDEFQINLSNEQIGRCLDHLSLVIQANEKMNLTRILNVDDALVLHILDSLLLLEPLEASPEGRFLDMGTGAGFPGIPLAIASGRPGILLDSVGKKVNAVQSFVDALGIDGVDAVHDRIEHYALSNGGSFSCVVARALASLPVLVEYASPYLELGGLFVVTKGRPDEDELVSGYSAAEVCGLDLIDTMSIELPHALGHREILVFEKIERPHVKLPRAVGLAKKSPIR
ncbi:16S rRNA (guanine(527)-N(7))-methyltransferase RsmG [Enorma burkinafasonensis]|uniref:16S rRNA (guanine(527)-N(7))-methyltransferase RsmG n=1 Tax=Enorma burkinafasonensis TaxID=2590867 RepID=UPI0011A5C879|nr:16S rRNA (guanine(527)-N(7))-methyltransferase RsmG [Enorma burkinafasonensis]